MTTTSEWLQKARDKQEDLLSLVANYHPSAGVARHKMEITAPAAEFACEVVRQSIATQETEDPVQRLKVALAVGDVAEIATVLDGAWFGVPESTSCWNICGFGAAVGLLEDPPEED